MPPTRNQETVAADELPDIEFEHVKLEETVEGYWAPFLSSAQDSVGFMWFGTDKRLFRYDGRNSVAFAANPRDSTSLSGSHIEALYVDSHGDLWVGTYSGLNRFDPLTEDFIHYRHDRNNDRSLSSDSVTAILEDRTGNLWVGTNTGLNRLDRKSGTFDRFFHDPNDPTSLSDNQISELYEDRSGTLWVGCGRPGRQGKGPNRGGLNRFYPKTESFTRYMHDPDDASTLVDGRVTAILEDSRGTFWVGTSGDGLHTMDREAGTFTRHRSALNHPDHLFPLYPNDRHPRRTTFVREDRAGILWIGVLWTGDYFGSSLHRYDPNKSRHVRFDLAVRYDQDGEPVMPDNGGFNTFNETRDGTIWIGTLRGLLRAHVTRRVQFEYVVDLDTVGTNADIMSVEETRDGSLWIGTWGSGMYRLDPSTGQIVKYRYDPSDSTSLDYEYVTTIHEDAAGTVWVPASDGLSRFNPAADGFELLHVLKRYGGVGEIHETGDGSLWMMKGGALNRLDPATDSLTIFHMPEAFAADGVFALEGDGSGGFWLGLRVGGLVHFSPGDSSWTHFPGRWSPLQVRDLLLDSRGTLWLATATDGLQYLDPERGIRPFPSPRSPCSADETVGSLFEDHTGAVWAAAPFELLRVEPEEGTCYRFGNKHGLDTGILNNLMNAKPASGGAFLIGHRTKILKVYPSRTFAPPATPTVTEMYLADETIQPGPDSPLEAPIWETNSIVLPHDQNAFAFDFTGFDYGHPETVQFRYRLENHDDAWRIAGAEAHARFSNVPPGEYVFQLKAANREGIWNPNAASLQILVRPPWWNTWWFRIAALGFIVALGVVAYRARVARLLEVERTRNRIADDLHDDLGSRLSTIALINEAAARDLTLNGSIKAQLNDAAQIARRAGDDLRDVIWIVDSGRDRLSDLIARLKKVGRQMLQGHEHRIIVPEDVPEIAVPMDVRRNVLLIYKEALHNAVRHANGAHIDVAVTLEHGKLSIHVRDTGQGFDMDGIRSGRGLQTMHERARHIGAHLQITSRPGEGTVVYFVTKNSLDSPARRIASS